MKVTTTHGHQVLVIITAETPPMAMHITCIPKIVYDGANGYQTEGGIVYTIRRPLIKISSDPHLAISRESQWYVGRGTSQPDKHSMNMDVYIIK